MRTQEKLKGLSSHRPVRAAPEQFGPRPTAAKPVAGPTVAEVLAPLVHVVLGNQPPARIEFWDDSVLGPEGGSGSVLVRSPDALRSLMWAPGELGLARAFVAGDLGFRGDIIAVLRALRDAAPRHRQLRVPLFSALRAAQRVGAIGLPITRPVEEVLPRGLRHSKQRDAHAIRHHYDISNDFYELVLGPTMTYSCAYFTETSATLEGAQVAKHDLVCRKLGLDQRAGMRLLDVGCGWGAMAMHAASTYGADVVGVTLSDAQAELARRRVGGSGAGGADRDPGSGLP